LSKLLSHIFSLFTLLTFSACEGVDLVSSNENITFDNAFISTWKTDNNGSTSNDQIKISTFNSGGDYHIDWGDGTIQTHLNNDTIHTYSQAGTYTIKISGDFPRIYFGTQENGYDPQKILSIQSWGDIKWTTMQSAFYYCSNLISTAVDTPDLSQVSSMSSMFYNASSFDANLSSWNTSSISSMTFAFYGAEAFNGDISTWNTSNVISMVGMFFNAYTFNQDLTSWNTAKVTEMTLMFNNASSFSNHDLSVWNVSNVISYASFLLNAGAGNTPPNFIVP
jgi:surface protein